MKQHRYQIMLEKDLIELLDTEAEKKGISRAEHIKDLLKASLSNQTLTSPKRIPMIRYQLNIPEWLRKELIERTKEEDITLSKYVREICWQSVTKKK